MRNRPSAYWLLILVLGALAGYTGGGHAAAERDLVVANPGTELWRAVRQREAPMIGSTQARNVAAGQLINPAGEQWREFRRERLIPIGGLVLAAAAGVVALLFLFRRAVPFAGGPSRRWVERFNAARRVGHWVMAVTMLLLALTGLILLFGRFGLLPWLGSESFGALAGLAKQSHDLLGPVFVAALLVFFVQFLRHNLPARGDLGWLLRLGGLIGHGHPPAGFFNAGEKTLFWLVIVLGTALSVSGLVLLLQIFQPERATEQLALLVHAVAAIGLTAVVFGHIYMALSIKGALQSMTSGRVDANWAQDHHRLWYEDVEARGLVQQDAGTPAPQSDAQSETAASSRV